MSVLESLVTFFSKTLGAIRTPKVADYNNNNRLYPDVVDDFLYVLLLLNRPIIVIIVVYSYRHKQKRTVRQLHRCVFSTMDRNTDTDGKIVAKERNGLRNYLLNCVFVSCLSSSSSSSSSAAPSSSVHWTETTFLKYLTIETNVRRDKHKQRHDENKFKLICNLFILDKSPLKLKSERPTFGCFCLDR